MKQNGIQQGRSTECEVRQQNRKLKEDQISGDATNGKDVQEVTKPMATSGADSLEECGSVWLPRQPGRTVSGQLAM
ncbi:hypothetical protein GN244_ATG15576 [Phytophthora infestans]|uniref:Uncharacterized protein n=1 Tax=Phytophthora infestans TaxID=4787 RepID=A0A833WFS5_PHYIN|nr:hypothetical protein GN244_ATG15576 [Phytophthora infestans]